MNKIDFEEAKKIATDCAKEHGKIIVRIMENEEYWLFDAGFEDGHRNFDGGIGSVYVSKNDGSTRNLQLWDVEFTSKFKSTAKEIYNYFNK